MVGGYAVSAALQKRCVFSVGALRLAPRLHQACKAVCPCCIVYSSSQGSLRNGSGTHHCTCVAVLLGEARCMRVRCELISFGLLSQVLMHACGCLSSCTAYVSPGDVACNNRRTRHANACAVAVLLLRAVTAVTYLNCFPLHI